MSDHRADRDIQQALARWMDGDAPTQAPTRLMEATFAETMKIGQQRVYPWHRLDLGGRPSAFGRSPMRAALVVVGMLLVVTLAIALGGGSSFVPPVPSPSPTSSPPSMSLPPFTGITAEATVPMPDLLGWEIEGTHLWGLVPGAIDRIDLATGEITGTVPVGTATNLWNGFARNDAGLWATEWETATLYRVDPASLEVVATIPAGKGPKGILANADGVWVADTHDGKVLRIDPATNTVVATVTVGPTGNSGPNWLAGGLGSVWVDIPNNATVVRIDPVTDTIQATLTVPQYFVACGGLAVGTDAVWVGGCDASRNVARFDPSTNTPVTMVGIPGHGGPTLIGDVPWLSIDTGDENTGVLVRIDPATNTIDRVLRPDVPFGGGGGIAVVANAVWVHDSYNGVLLRFPLAAFGV